MIKVIGYCDHCGAEIKKAIGCCGEFEILYSCECAQKNKEENK